MMKTYKIDNNIIEENDGTAVNIAGSEGGVVADSKFYNNGSALNITNATGAHVISGNHFKGNHNAISISFADPLLERLGLPQNTNMEELIALLRTLQQAPEEQRKSIISNSFLSTLNNLTGIANNILQALPHLPQF